MGDDFETIIRASGLESTNGWTDDDITAACRQVFDLTGDIVKSVELPAVAINAGYTPERFAERMSGAPAGRRRWRFNAERKEYERW